MPSRKNRISGRNVDPEHQRRGRLGQISQTTIRPTTSAARSIDRTLGNGAMIDERALASAPPRDGDHIILDQEGFVLGYQRDGILYAGHPPTGADKLPWDTPTIQLRPTRFTDDFEPVESPPTTVMPAFKAINVPELVTPEPPDQPMPAFIDEPSATAVMAPVMAEPQQDTSVIPASEGHTLTATPSATATRAHVMLEPPNQLHAYPTKPPQDPDVITAAERPIPTIERPVAKGTSKKRTLDDTIRMPTTPPSKKAKTRVSAAASNEVINVEEGQTIRRDAETVTYISRHGTFSVSQVPTGFDEPLHGLLQTQINDLRKDLPPSIFGSALEDLELKSLDLRSNGDLFPTLVNKEGELRERAIKVPASRGSKATTEAAHTAMARKLTLKANAFRALAEAASKQEKAYLAEAELLRATNEGTEGADKMQSTNAGLSAIIKSAKPTITAEEWNNLSNSLADHLTTLAERYRRELSVLIVYLRRATQELNKREISLSSLLHYARDAIKQDGSLATIFPQFITKLEPSAHVCQCTACKATTPPPTIHEEPELKATTPPPTIHEEPELEPSLEEEKEEDVPNYGKMPGSW